MIENRLWLVVTKADDGSAQMTFTTTQPPEPEAGTAVVRTRGMVHGDLVVTIPAPPVEP